MSKDRRHAPGSTFARSTDTCSRFCSCTVAVVTLLVGLGRDARAEAGAFIAAVNEHQSHLAKIFRPAGSPNKEDELDRRLAEPEPLSQGLSCGEQVRLVSRVIASGLEPTLPPPNTGYIEDDVVVGILLRATRDDCKDVRYSAQVAMAEHVRPRQLAPYADMLKAECFRAGGSCNVTLLSLLPLTDEERAILLAKGGLLRDVRARLGDTAAEAELIARFEAATGFRAREDAAEELGFAGTRRCGEALVRALRMDMVEKEPNVASIRLYIIEALGRIHPDEPLLTSEIRKIANVGDTRYGGPERIREYLSQVYEWARQTYGIVPEGPEPAPILFEWTEVKHQRLPGTP